MANIIHNCVFKYYLSSNLQSVVAAFSCNTLVYAFVTLSPTVSFSVAIAAPRDNRNSQYLIRISQKKVRNQSEKSLSFWGASFTRPFFEEFFIEQSHHSQK
ncbi:MAG: hypothetical protein KME50_21345 [Nostoc desertorum CM1-VF14]|nr:hypothetical protein [Nostoc desertorum CM1-VF14]